MKNITVLHYDEDTQIEIELDVKIDLYQPLVKGVYSGTWENSYPDEPAEVEYTISKDGYSHLENDDEFGCKVMAIVEEILYE
tara:strand:- start:156 stop:401 length:246 start_codon:yes stop_codon:yes gene_type:complete